MWALLLQWSILGYAQSPYKLSVPGDAAALTLGTGLSLFGYHVTQGLEPLSVSDISMLNAKEINRFDRFAVSQSSKPSQWLSDVALFSSLALPAAYFGRATPKSEYLKLGIMGAETILLTTGLTLSAKGIVKRIRPYAYHTDVAIDKKLVPDTRTSFFSGHTSVSSAMSFFVFSTVSQYDCSRPLKRTLRITAIALPAFVGSLRVMAGKHYLTDVLVGYAVGAISGWAIPYFHTLNSRIQIMPGASSISMVYKI